MSSHSWLVAMPSDPTRNPALQHSAATTIAARGPCRSTHVPPKAADSPSMTMAMEKMAATGVCPVPKCATSEVLKTLKA